MSPSTQTPPTSVGKVTLLAYHERLLRQPQHKAYHSFNFILPPAPEDEDVTAPNTSLDTRSTNLTLNELPFRSTAPLSQESCNSSEKKTSGKEEYYSFDLPPPLGPDNDLSESACPDGSSADQDAPSVPSQGDSTTGPKGSPKRTQSWKEWLLRVDQ
jgi:hypothetical protein